MIRFLKAAILASAVAGVAAIVSAPAHAQNAQCIAKDQGGKTLFQMTSGQILKFVPADSAFMRNINAQSAPALAGKVASVELQPRCQAVIYGGGGANWGHRRVQTSGSVGVPAAHVFGFKCECQ